MATIQENKAYIEDSSRFPKLQSVELVQPRYQFTNEEYNRIVEYLGQLYTLSQSAVTSVDASLDVASTKPLENRVVAAAIARLTSTANRIKISFFKGIEQSGTVRQTSSPLSSEPEEVSFYEDAGTFGFKPSSGEGIVTTQYYNNWQNRDEYTDENLEPYTAKVYYCIDNKTLYIYEDGELIGIGGGNSNVDNALSTSSENPVQNKVIAGALADKANIADVYSKQQVDNLISQSAVTVDTALSPSSTNPIQNKKVAEALDGKVGGADYSDGDLVLYSDPEKTNEIDRVNLNVDRILSFEIDDTTGFLMMTEENMGSSMDFEIDENGNLNLILE